MGRVFPPDDLADCYAVVVAAALRDELGSTHHAIKTVIKWTGANERTVKNWLAGASGPSGANLIALARNSDEVFGALLVLMRRDASQKQTPSALLDLRERLRQALTLAESLVRAAESSA